MFEPRPRKAAGGILIDTIETTLGLFILTLQSLTQTTNPLL
jgi:hypothetical protein